MAEPELCRDCKYVVGENLEHARCSHPEVMRRDGDSLVTGLPEQYCSTERGNDFSSPCGPEGKLFEKGDPVERKSRLTKLRELFERESSISESRLEVYEDVALDAYIYKFSLSNRDVYLMSARKFRILQSDVVHRRPLVGLFLLALWARGDRRPSDMWRLTRLWFAKPVRIKFSKTSGDPDDEYRGVS